MMLKEIMTSEVEVIRPNASLKEAATKMKDLDVGLIPVRDGDRLCGMLTDRDITVRSTALGNDPANTAVEEVMTKEVVYAFEDQDESVAAMLMEAKQIRRLIILNRDKRLGGIVSLGDLATRAAHKSRSAETLQEVSKPA